MSDSLTIGPSLPPSSFFDKSKSRVRIEHHLKFEVKFRDEGSPARLAHIRRELRKLGVHGVEVRVIGGVADRIRAVQLNPSKSCPPSQNLKSGATFRTAEPLSNADYSEMEKRLMAHFASQDDVRRQLNEYVSEEV